jgi:ABC-type multidrug transport system fused ATPase/permease subunit
MTAESRPHRTIAFSRYIHLFHHYLSPQWRKALLMTLALLLSIGLQLIGPQLVRAFIDAAAAQQPLATLTRTALIFLALAVIRQLCVGTATYLGTDVGWSATNAIRQDLARHALGLDMRFHNSRTAGEMIERIDGDVTALSDFFAQFGVRVLGALLLLVGILAVLWLENPWVGAAMTGFALLELIIMTKARELGVAATRLEREANAKLFGFVEERLSGIEDIRANGGGAHAMHRFSATMRDFFRASRRAWMLRSVIWLTGYGLFIVGMGGTIGAAIYLAEVGRITIGTAYLVLQYLLMLLTPLDQITQQMQTLQRAAASIGRIDELLATESTLRVGNTLRLPTGALELRFDDVSFAYDHKPTLQRVSFCLRPGAVLGLLGRTGSGKSTLTRLLCRFYDATEGVITLSGVPIEDFAPDQLQQHVGMVTQEVQLFQGSLRDNLTFFDASISDEQIHAVLAELELSDWLAALPQGLDTSIAAGGSNLSAGEAQLLAFTRVFLKDPGLVILDEPSSRLDPATEARLGRAVDKLLKGRTAIIIAHRLETIRRADEIMILADGRVIEHGPRKRLAADPGSQFAALLAAGNVDMDSAAEGRQLVHAEG